MHSARIEVRVRYVETDRMGIAHHTHHFSWMEQARTELMRQNGMLAEEIGSFELFEVTTTDDGSVRVTLRGTAIGDS